MLKNKGKREKIVKGEKKFCYHWEDIKNTKKDSP